MASALPDARGRTIRPGANDDAIGVAGLLEIARAFKRGPRPDRSILFGFWTAEERGLLGSEAYALKPVVPANKVAANITLDILNTGGPSRDVMLVGQGQNSLEAELTRAATAQGRSVTPEALPERGLFYRADHFPMAKRGVPTLLLMAISGAPDLVKGGREAGTAWLDGYMKCYHQTCDEWSPDLDFHSVAADVALAYQVGRSVARAGVWPAWNECLRIPRGARGEPEGAQAPMIELLGAERFNIGPHAVALLIAYVLALPIGWNREKAERSAGLRTFPLVAIASCGFVQAAEAIGGDIARSDGADHRGPYHRHGLHRRRRDPAA